MKRRWARWRDRLRDKPAAEFGYRIAIAVIGLAVLTVGILAIPYPGPGWAIVVATLWFLGAVGWSAGLVGLEHEWLKSPICLGA